MVKYHNKQATLELLASSFISGAGLDALDVPLQSMCLGLL